MARLSANGERFALQCLRESKGLHRQTHKLISDPLERSGVFPPMVTQMVLVGEETGSLEEMLTKIADFYDEEVDTAVGTLTTLIEPIMIVVLGVVVAGIVVALYLPIFRLATVIH